MSMINKEVSDFTVQAFQDGAFQTVTKSDILGEWSVFFFYPADCTFVWPTSCSAGSRPASSSMSTATRFARPSGNRARRP